MAWLGDETVPQLDPLVSGGDGLDGWVVAVHPACRGEELSPVRMHLPSYGTGEPLQHRLYVGSLHFCQLTEAQDSLSHFSYIGEVNQLGKSIHVSAAE